MARARITATITTPKGHCETFAASLTPSYNVEDLKKDFASWVNKNLPKDEA